MIRVKVRARARPRAWARVRLSSPTSKSTGTQPVLSASMMPGRGSVSPGGCRQKSEPA